MLASISALSATLIGSAERLDELKSGMRVVSEDIPSGRLVAPLSLLLPCYLVCIMVGWRGMLEVWPAVVVVGAAFASVQFLMSNFVGPQLADIMSSLCALGALLLLLRFWRPAKLWDRELEPVVPVGTEKKYSALAPASGQKHTTGQILGAWLPYGLLVILVLLWGYPPVHACSITPPSVLAGLCCTIMSS